MDILAYLSINQHYATPEIQSINWCLLSEQSKWKTAQNLASWLDECSKIDQLNNVYLVLPDSVCIQGNIACPAKNLKKAKITLPFLLEEYTLTPAESLHSIVTEIRNENVSFCSIDKSFATQTKQHLTPSIFNKVFLLAVSSLFYETEKPLILAPGDQSITILKDHEIICSNRNNLEILTTQMELDLSNIKTLAEDEFLIALKKNTQSLLFSLQKHNLFTGELSISKKSIFQNKWFKLTTSIAAALWFFHIGFSIYTLNTLKSVSDKASQESLELYKKHFPNEKRIINPKRQIQAKIKHGNNNKTSEFMNLLPQFIHTLKKIEQLTVTQPNSIEFDRKNGELKLNLTAASIIDIENIRDSAIKEGLNTEYHSVFSKESGYDATFVIY